MKTKFFDRQDPHNPINGQVITTSAELRKTLRMVHGRPPFFAELIGDNGFKLLLGLGATEGCAQFSAADGSAPYFMAVATNPAPGEMSFLIGDTASPVPGRYCIPHDVIVGIAEVFVETGERRNDMRWEEI